jgi:hypothetical protein
MMMTMPPLDAGAAGGADGAPGGGPSGLSRALGAAAAGGGRGAGGVRGGRAAGMSLLASFGALGGGAFGAGGGDDVLDAWASRVAQLYVHARAYYGLLLVHPEEVRLEVVEPGAGEGNPAVRGIDTGMKCLCGLTGVPFPFKTYTHTHTCTHTHTYTPLVSFPFSCC